LLRTAHVRTIFPSCDGSPRSSLYCESGRGDAGRSLFFVLRHETEADALARRLIALYKSPDLWTRAEDLLTHFRFEIASIEKATGKPAHLALALIEPPRMLFVAKGDGLVGIDEGHGLAFNADLAPGIPRLLMRDEHDGSTWCIHTPRVGQSFALGFGEDLRDADGDDVAALPRFLERDPRPSAAGRAVATVVERGGCLVVGRLNHLPWVRAAVPPERLRPPWSRWIPDRLAGAGALALAVAVFLALVGIGSPSVHRHPAAVRVKTTSSGTGLLWRLHLESPAVTPLLPVGSQLFVPCADGGVDVVDATAGRAIRRLQISMTAGCRPLFVGGLLICGGADGALLGVDPVLGDTRWRLPLAGAVRDLAADGDRVWVAAAGSLSAVDVASGRVKWIHRSPATAFTGLDVANGIGVAACDDGSVFAFDPATGRERWRHALGAAPAGGPTIVKGRVYVATRDGRVRSLRTARGTVVWTQELRLPLVGRPAVDGERLYVAARTGPVVALDAASGDVSWRQGEPAEANGVEPSAPFVHGRLVVLRDRDGAIRALDVADGRPVSTHRLSQPARGDPVLIGSRLFALTRPNALEAIAFPGSPAVGRPAPAGRQREGT
jgi:outer membrane protein assembly factor BamB